MATSASLGASGPAPAMTCPGLDKSSYSMYAVDLLLLGTANQIRRFPYQGSVVHDCSAGRLEISMLIDV